MNQLFALRAGSGPRRAIFLHGFLGQGKNLATLARSCSDLLRYDLLDLPNHGRAAHVPVFDYDQMTTAVASWLIAEGFGPATVVGHSMGAKVAMRLALRYPQLVDRVLLLDPTLTPHQLPHELPAALRALLAIDLDQLATRREADQLLALRCTNARLRGFLLQNLYRRADGTFGWRANLPVLAESLELVTGWPPLDRVFAGAVQVLIGADSDQSTPADVEQLRSYFPMLGHSIIPNAGHWLHTDQPEATAAALRRFLTSR